MIGNNIKLMYIFSMQETARLKKKRKIYVYSDNKNSRMTCPIMHNKYMYMKRDNAKTEGNDGSIEERQRRRNKIEEIRDTQRENIMGRNV
jgi:hypothetical protein